MRINKPMHSGALHIIKCLTSAGDQMINMTFSNAAI